MMNELAEILWEFDPCIKERLKNFGEEETGDGDRDRDRCDEERIDLSGCAVNI